MARWTGRLPRTRFPPRSSRSPTAGRISAAPPASGAWRAGDDPGDRQFVPIGDLPLESGATLPGVTIAYESWGELNARRQQRDPGPARPHRRQPRHRAGEAGASDGRLVVGARRLRQAARPRRLVRRRPEHAGRLPGLDRPGIGGRRRRGVGFPLSVPQHPGPGRRAARVLRRHRRDPLGRRAGRLDGRDAGAGVGGRLPRSRRAGRGARRSPAVERRPDRAQLGAERGDPVRSGVRRRRLLRRAPTAPARTAVSPSPAAWRC